VPACLLPCLTRPSAARDSAEGIRTSQADPSGKRRSDAGIHKGACSGYVILITDAEELLRANEDDYATFVDIVSSAGEYWATPRFDGSHRAAAPFHLLLLTSPDRAATRNWRVPRLEVEVGR
jgi:hypothetical protein